MICPKCGSSVPTGANFCMKCGAALSEMQAPQKVMRLEIPVGEAHPSSAPERGPQTTSARPARKGLPPKVLLAVAAASIGVVFVALVLAVALWLARRGSDRPSTNTTATARNVRDANSSIAYDKEALREMTLALVNGVGGIETNTRPSNQYPSGTDSPAATTSGSPAAIMERNGGESEPAENDGSEEDLSSSSAINTMRVRFAPGSSSTTIGGSVARGRIDRYLFDARAGQQLTLLLSPGGNAKFILRHLDDGGSFLSDETRSWSGSLTTTGTYAVDVSTSDMKADYKLFIAIR